MSQGSCPVRPPPRRLNACQTGSRGPTGEASLARWARTWAGSSSRGASRAPSSAIGSSPSSSVPMLVVLRRIKGALDVA
eukprot:scaffold7225_cov379-Prasinococcus_capsulatus_cf.AAC.7